ncbi:amino acid ABC transporter permease [Ketogulonicigenium vulgare]|uniref:Amino acid ABC transporter, permease protein, 3-TM region, His/Glu/Gln/Arg/opine family protein n=1 Tax=Ketogulonicigenium vulgare (strain WSH-001) TaxID=759362 RepID=F9Y7N8_KETVW|nr:amino acid ABC transporter permease [Ketogulonicigenium vulgare]ADO41480.1 polar amino acid ABC transporter, inner membrane subunit [Ketogulonicigenium vulgare Y25]AEM42334.1 Amino acid ABC transporter, permease protein, 3-TM region, His/Glu/Gln/Arg/opine family protein [Ketogulonicigenium vulgare WSH-001]ALJ79960.1 amino acid ABC transporter permease [Ketogulonicigenium vulgare]ANW32852.1 amino acid ABC transporter permease [Ketogulonicigenium vulgare]AOZ53416.1 polar amino acid ABC transp
MQTFGTGHFIYLLNGLWWTIILSALAMSLGSIAGFIVMLGRISRRKWLVRLSGTWVQIIQGTPLLIQMFIIYFGLGVVGISVPALAAAAIATMIYASAYLGEIWRGCVQSIAKTQFEAAESMGLTRWQALRDVILPQAMRIATPPTVGFTVQLIKNTSLASVVGFLELTRAAQVINNSLFEPFLVFGIAAALYFAVCYPLSLWSRNLERKLNVGRR